MCVTRLLYTFTRFYESREIDIRNIYLIYALTKTPIYLTFEEGTSIRHRNLRFFSNAQKIKIPDN